MVLVFGQIKSLITTAIHKSQSALSSGGRGLSETASAGSGGFAGLRSSFDRLLNRGEKILEGKTLRTVDTFIPERQIITQGIASVDLFSKGTLSRLQGDRFFRVTYTDPNTGIQSYRNFAVDRNTVRRNAGNLTEFFDSLSTEQGSDPEIESEITDVYEVFSF